MLATRCISCGDELLEERAQLGYEYCTRKQCQARHHQGVTVTAIGVNKSADTFLVGDAEEIRKRAEAGEFAKKDSGLGLDYWRGSSGPALPRQSRRTPEQARQAPSRRPWTADQERIVRLYNEMGLTPRQIVERARENTPRLGITEALVTRIICAPPRR